MVDTIHQRAKIFFVKDYFLEEEDNLTDALLSGSYNSSALNNIKYLKITENQTPAAEDNNHKAFVP